MSTGIRLTDKLPLATVDAIYGIRTNPTTRSGPISFAELEEQLLANKVGAGDAALAARLDEEVANLQAEIEAAATGTKSAKTWAELSAVVGTVALQKGEVTNDAGTHTDPVVGGTVANEGFYSWSTSPAGWKRTADRVDETTLTAEIVAVDTKINGLMTPVLRASPSDIGIVHYDADTTGRIRRRFDWMGREKLSRAINADIAFNGDSALSIIRPGQYTSDQSSGVINLAGLGCARIELLMGRGTYNATDKIEWVVRHGDDPNSLTGVTTADIAGPDAIAVTGGIVYALTSSQTANQRKTITYVGGKKYVEVIARFSGTHAVASHLGARITRGVIGGGVVTTTQASPTIDLRGSREAAIAVFLGRGGIDFTSVNKIGLRAEHTFDGSTWLDVAASDFDGPDAPIAVSGGIIKEWTSRHRRARAYSMHYVGGARRIRLTWVFSGAHATGTFCDATVVHGRVEPIRAPNGKVIDPLKRDPLRDPQVPRVLAQVRETTQTGTVITRLVLDRADYEVVSVVSLSDDGMLIPDRNWQISLGESQSLGIGSGSTTIVCYRQAWPDHVTMPSMANGINNYACGTDRRTSTLPTAVVAADILGVIPAVDREAGPGGQDSNLHGQTLVGALQNASASREASAFGSPRGMRTAATLGVGGITIENLLPTSGLTIKPYNDKLAYITRMVQLAAAAGEHAVVSCIPIKHGEANSTTTASAYHALLKELILDLCIDAMCLTGQASWPTVIMSQWSGFQTAQGGSTDGILLAAQAGDIVMPGPDYPVKFIHGENLYVDVFHMDGWGYAKLGGAWWRDALERSRYGVGRPGFLEPIRAVASGTTIDVTFALAEPGKGGAIKTSVTDRAGTINGVVFSQTGGTPPTVVSMSWVGTSAEIADGFDVLRVVLSGSIDGSSPKIDFGILGMAASYSEPDRPMTRLCDTSALTNPLDVGVNVGRTYERYCAHVRGLAVEV